MASSFAESRTTVLDNLQYFHDGDPQLEASILHLWEMTWRMAGNLRLLLHGETGSGKEALAHAAHEWMSEKPGKFVTTNCATIPPEMAVAELFGARKGSYTGSSADYPGLFVQATNAADTVFLDEIHKIPVLVQAELLRVLGSGKFKRLGDKDETTFNGNVIAASSSNIADMKERGEFPGDLYYRLSQGGEVRVPSLRERTVRYRDALIDHGCKHWGVGQFSLEEGLRETLLAMHFPGNVRELRSILHQLSKTARFTDGIATHEQLQRILVNRAPVAPMHTERGI